MHQPVLLPCVSRSHRACVSGHVHRAGACRVTRGTSSSCVRRASANGRLPCRRQPCQSPAVWATPRPVVGFSCTSRQRQPSDTRHHLLLCTSNQCRWLCVSRWHLPCPTRLQLCTSCQCLQLQGATASCQVRRAGACHIISGASSEVCTLRQRPWSRASSQCQCSTNSSAAAPMPVSFAVLLEHGLNDLCPQVCSQCEGLVRTWLPRHGGATALLQFMEGLASEGSRPQSS